MNRIVTAIGSRTAFRIVAAITVALGLLILCAHLDGNADSTADAGYPIQRPAHVEAAARDLCTEELGPGTKVLWTTDGDLVCRPFSLPIASN